MQVGDSQTCSAGLPLNKNNMAAWATDVQALLHPILSKAEVRGERATTAIRDSFVLFYSLRRLYGPAPSHIVATVLRATRYGCAVGQNRLIMHALNVVVIVMNASLCNARHREIRTTGVYTRLGMWTTAIKLYSTFSLRRPMGGWPSTSSLAMTKIAMNAEWLS